MCNAFLLLCMLFRVILMSLRWDVAYLFSYFHTNTAVGIQRRGLLERTYTCSERNYRKWINKSNTIMMNTLMSYIKNEPFRFREMRRSSKNVWLNLLFRSSYKNLMLSVFTLKTIHNIHEINRIFLHKLFWLTLTLTQLSVAGAGRCNLDV